MSLSSFKASGFSLGAFVLLASSSVVLAQQAPQQPAPPPQQAQPAPQTPSNGEWAKLPHMQLERQFAGPLQDTVIQRWRDPVDGVVCYIYLPITAAHSAPMPSGFVEYGANAIGSVSCLQPPKAAAAPAEKKPAAEK